MNKKTVEHIAHLAKLKISEEELIMYTQQLSHILGHFEELSKVNTEGIEPLVTPIEIEQTLRADEVKMSLKVDDVLQNAPARVGNLYKVPPVV